jgi:hypothetical protein
MGNYKTSASANTAWLTIKKKLLADKGTLAGQSTPTPKGAQGKPEAAMHAGAMVNTVDDHEEGGEFTPINTPKKKQNGKAKDIEPTDGDEISTPQPKKGGAKVKPETEDNGEDLATPKSKKRASNVNSRSEADGEEITDSKLKKRVTKKKAEAHDEGEEGAAPKAGIDVKMETGTGDEAPAASGNIVTPNKKGRKSTVKPEADDAEVKQATPVPNKKRLRKAKDDAKPTPKRTKASAADKSTKMLGNQGGEENTLPTASSSLGGEGNRDEVFLSADLEAKMYKSASEHSRMLAEGGSGNTDSHDALTPPEDTENDQEGNEVQTEEI